MRHVPGRTQDTVVRREKVAVLTRATLTDPEMLAAHPDAVFLMALAELPLPAAAAAAGGPGPRGGGGGEGRDGGREAEHGSERATPCAVWGTDSDAWRNHKH